MEGINFLEVWDAMVHQSNVARLNEPCGKRKGMEHFKRGNGIQPHRENPGINKQYNACLLK